MIVGWISRNHFDSGRGGTFFLTSLLIELIEGSMSAMPGYVKNRCDASAIQRNFTSAEPHLSRRSVPLTAWGYKTSVEGERTFPSALSDLLS